MIKNSNRKEMKNRIALATALVLVLNGVVWANGEKASKKEAKKATAVQVIPGSDKTFKVVYAKANNEMVKVKLMDENGKAITEDRIANRDGFYKPYNLSQLASGSYVFEITDSEETFSKTVDVKEYSVKALVLPTGNTKGFKLLVPSTHDSAISVKIYNGNKLVGEDRIKSSEGFVKNYDLSGVRGKDLNIEIFHGYNMIIAQNL
jgi:hypothetical protein